MCILKGIRQLPRSHCLSILYRCVKRITFMKRLPNAFISVSLMNDTGVSPGAFLARTRDTYIAVYCFEGASGGAAPPGGGAASGEGPP
jgi:hypothetical protein